MPLPLKTLAAELALIALTVPRAAFAQGSSGETIHGTIVSLNGAGNVELRDDRGFVDSVRLEPNVEVTPAGVQLVPGMRVTISGGPRFSIGIGFGFGANGFRGHYRH